MMNWLHDRRKELGMSQEDLAIQLQLQGIQKVSRSIVSQWETGLKRLPTHRPPFTKALSVVLKMTVADVLRKSGQEMPTTYAISAQRAAEIVNQLDPAQQKLAVNLLEQLLKV